MRAGFPIAFGLAVTLMSCSKPAATDVDVVGSSPFPQKGNYHVTHDIVQGNESTHEESDYEIDGFDREQFEKEIAKDDGAGSNCRDKDVSVGDGTFRVQVTCGTPDGDFRNIRVDRYGSFSRDSFDVTTETTLLGVSYKESYSARLKD